MNRKFLVIAAFAVWAQCSAVFAQVAIPERADVHTVVALKVDRTFPSGSKVKYRWAAPTLSIGDGTADNKIAYATGKPGSHPGSLTVAWIEGDALQLERHDWTLVIGDAPPQPVVKTLADLAGDKAQIIGQLLAVTRDHSLPIAKTVDALLAGFTGGLATIDVKPDHPAIVEIVKRIGAVGSGAIDDQLRESLGKAIAKVIADLGAKPPGPVVVEGKRTLYVVRETANIDPDLARVVEDIQGGRTTEAQYLASKGHLVTLVDPGDVDPTGQPTPAVAKLTPAIAGLSLPVAIVVDQATGAILSKQSVNADTVSAAQLVDFVKANGG